AARNRDGPGEVPRATLLLLAHVEHDGFLRLGQPPLPLVGRNLGDLLLRLRHDLIVGLGHLRHPSTPSKRFIRYSIQRATPPAYAGENSSRSIPSLRQSGYRRDRYSGSGTSPRKNAIFSRSARWSKPRRQSAQRIIHPPRSAPPPNDSRAACRPSERRGRAPAGFASAP